MTLEGSLEIISRLRAFKVYGWQARYIILFALQTNHQTKERLNPRCHPEQARTESAGPPAKDLFCSEISRFHSFMRIGCLHARTQDFTLFLTISEKQS